MKNRKNITFVIVLLLALLLNSCSLLFEFMPGDGEHTGGGGPSGWVSIDQSEFDAINNDWNPPAPNNFEEAMLNEVNFARTKPKVYAKYRLKAYYDNGTDNGACYELMYHKAVPALELQNQLCKAAQKYAQYMAVNNVWGHYENGNPSDRCKAEGYKNYMYVGENIACGYGSGQNAEVDFKKAAIVFVRQLIIDKDVPSLGHRKNIMRTSYNQLGVGFYRNESADYKNYVVQDFGSQ